MGSIDGYVEKAKNMKIPLVSKEVGSGDPYKGSLEFMGGFAPFVYTDAGGGVEEGSFEIHTECHALFNP